GINVVTASLDDEPVRASRGTVLLADKTLDQALQQNYDMVVLPGGLPGADHLNSDPRILKLLANMADKNKITAAICAAPKVLASAGLLSGKRATAFPGVLEKLGLPDTSIVNDPVVIDGNVITSRGPGTAMDFALQLIEVLTGKDKRNSVEAALQRS
ncbi:MAG: DJ-1/PfpI family protein, partial [Gammaproteobacteria bacterium]|nr:DJ-1/PfpI family protein [Gammaproteobacteria bacterium]